ncbi:MAG: hypothetical protein ABL967_09785 [Bryobacteraceae bacterium]
MNRIVGVTALLVLAGGMTFSAYLAYADAEFRKGTPEGVAKAAEMRPENTRYLMLRALHLDYDGADSTTVLERIAVLNPMASAPRIRLGLAAELRGDPVTAEHWLLSAARVDHQFEPSWTLANFYYRQNRPEDFWTAMRQALEVSYGDRAPAFELCWRMAGEPGEILERVFSRNFPGEDEVAAAYLHFLMERHSDAAGAEAMERAALHFTMSGQVAARKDPQVLYAIVDLLMDRARWQGAKTLWTSLGNPEARGVSNGEFHELTGAAKGHGFDWRWEPNEGVLHLPLDGSGHRIAFTGKQQEYVAVLHQFVLAEKGKRYTLRWTSRTSNLASQTGLRWEVQGASAANETSRIEASKIETSNDWRPQAMTLTAASDVLRLVLVYQRPQGLARADGSVDLQLVSLAPAN